MNSSIARLIGPGSNLEEIRALLAQIEEEKEQPPKEEEKDNEEGTEEVDTVQLLNQKLDDLEADFEKVSNYLYTAQKIIDNISLPVLFDMVNNAIVDYRSAYNSTTFYTLEWFSRSYLSEEGKIRFAEYLLETVKNFTQDNTESWKLIIERDSGTLTYIAFPKNS